jgi:tetratricopeptide (TPR) repeat protein
MFPEKFQELEEKIRLTAELIAQLRQEKTQLKRDHQEAEKRIAELEGEIKRLRAERQTTSPPMDTVIQHLNTRPGDAQEQTLHRLTEMLVKEPTNVKVLFELGNAYERQGMYEQAIEEYRKALRIDADFVDAIEHLAFLLEKLNRDHEASPLWERILSLKKHA